MALKLTVRDTKGQITEYHKIGIYSVNTFKNVIDINMVSYTSQEYRNMEKPTENEPAKVENGQNIVVSIGISIPIIDGKFDIADIYPEIKKLEAWSTAEDC